MRSQIVKILMDVEVSKSYSNIALRKNLRGSSLTTKERAYVTEVVYGTIEKKYLIDYIINKVSKIKVKKMSNYVKIIIRIATYELVFMNTKSYAVINEAVNLCKKYDRKSFRFVNGVLRNIMRQYPDILLDLEAETGISALRTRYSVSEDIVKLWMDEYGEKRAEEILKSLSNRAKTYVRINSLAKVPKEYEGMDIVSFVESEFEKSGIEYERLDYPKNVYRVKKTGNFEELEIFKDGFITVQDVSSMVPVMMLNPKEGDSLIDVCAAPGGKSVLASEMMENIGHISAFDIYDHKLDLIKSYSKRMGITIIDAKIQDAMTYNKELKEKFDRAIVDVPCSGFGIIRRKPEIRYKSLKEIEDLPGIQIEILENVSKYLKVGGEMVYSTCTLNPRENREVVELFLKRNQGFEIVDISDDIDLESLGAETENSMVTIMPDLKGYDGFFAVKLKKLQ